MHLVVACAGVDSFILEGVDATSPVAVLRLQIAERLRVDARVLKVRTASAWMAHHRFAESIVAW